jgi:hypothetical protein
MSIVHYVCYYLYTDAKKQSPGFVEVGQLRESLINSVVSWGGDLMARVAFKIHSNPKPGDSEQN